LGWDVAPFFSAGPQVAGCAEAKVETPVISGVAGVTPKYRQALHWSLVLTAVGIPHVLRRQTGGWTILVPPEEDVSSRREIEAYEAENRNWPPPRMAESPEERRRFASTAEPPTIVVIGGLLVFYALTGPWSEKSIWFEQGAVSVRRILEQGEWWRVVTALTLHADPVHLFGNALIGGAFIHFLSRMLGSGFAWSLILFAGALGNTLNVLFRDGNFLSVGFSTAIFGAIGIFCGLKVRPGMALRELVLPAGAGIGLFAMLGVEGKQTDLGAHLWGLVAGGGLGMAVSLIPAFYLLTRKAWVQALLFLVCCLVVIGSWQLAL